MFDPFSPHKPPRTKKYPSYLDREVVGLEEPALAKGLAGELEVLRAPTPRFLRLLEALARALEQACVGAALIRR